MTASQINTIVSAKLPEREGQFSFTKASVTTGKNGRLMVGLADEDGNVLNISFERSDLKRLISWRMLLG